MKTNYFSFHRILLIGSLYTVLLIFADQDLNAQNAPAKQWDKTFGANNNEELTILQPTSDGGYILGGVSLSGKSADKSEPSRGNNDFWIIKIDATGNKQWDKTLGGSDMDVLYSLQQTSDNGYILGGSSFSGVSGDKTDVSNGISDYWIVKLDSIGNKLWDRTFGGNATENLRAIQQTPDGGYFLGGYSESGVGLHKSEPTIGNYDFWVLKLDSLGNKQWDKTIGGDQEDALFSIQPASDGGYVLGGYSGSGISGDKSSHSRGISDFWVVKIDSAGNKIWDKTFGGSGQDNICDMHQTTDGGYILGGMSYSGLSGEKTQPSRGHFDFWIVKIDSIGNKQWDRTIGGDREDVLLSIRQTSDGGFIAGGYSGSNVSGEKSEPTHGVFDYWIIKLDSNGNFIWEKIFGGSDNDRLWTVRQLPDQTFILGGTSNSRVSADKTQNPKGLYDFWIVKLGSGMLGANENHLNSNLSLSPNPNSGKFTLQLNNLQALSADVTITDVLGRIIFTQQLPVINQQLSTEMEIGAAKGLYLLQIQVGSRLLTRKIIVE